MTFVLVVANEPCVQRKLCCEQMTAQANLRSPMAESALLGTIDRRIYWSSIFNEYGLICQPSAEVLLIGHCPFCGTQLPPSRRDEWFRKLEATGWRTWGDPIPEAMLSNEWHAV